MPSFRPQWQTSSYRGRKTNEISFPLGGLGTGCVGLAGNGRLIDWEVANKPNKGSLNGLTHFAVKAERDGQLLDARVLQGDLSAPYTGGFLRETFFEGYGFGPRRENLAGMPHFQSHSFRGEFPFAEIEFSDPAFPGEIRLFAFNPFIPLQEKDSGLPAAFFEFELTNNSNERIDYTVAGLLSNPFGQNQPGNSVEQSQGRTTLRVTSGAKDLGVGWGEMTLATDEASVSYQEYLYRGIWCDDLQMYWNDFLGGAQFQNRAYEAGKTNAAWSQKDSGVLAAHVSLESGESRVIRFLLAWHYPTVRNDWDPAADARAQKARLKNIWKNWYATEWVNAAIVTDYAFARWDTLLRETILFHDTVYRSTLPPVVLEAITANLAILKSPTVSRLEDGTFYGWEGVSVSAGACEGSCTHVWNYAQALAFLFPRLERSMREANYRYNVDEHGGSHFRLQLPLGTHHDQYSFRPCADGQFGDVLKTYRDWKISGDTAWLAALWPELKKTVAYAWHPENLDRWDPDRTGVLWGRQHHTLDMELFGPNSWLTGFYLGALKACVEMGEHLKDEAFARECRALFERGKQWVDEHLFNGEYFGQKLDLTDRDLLSHYDLGERETGVFVGKVTDVYWSEEAGEIKYQLGEGCGIDAVVAQWQANLSGLGDIFDPRKVRSTVQAIYRHNFRSSARQLANPWRLYRLNDEAGAVMCEWPPGKTRPSIPVPYAQESMTGFEYALAALLIQNGLVEEGAACVTAIRSRYDGEKRNPWNEMECGSNYARAMASYSLLNAFSGFSFDAVKQSLGFWPVGSAKEFRCFWSLDAAWGEMVMTSHSLLLSVSCGELLLRQFTAPFSPSKVQIGEREVSFILAADTVEFATTISLQKGTTLAFSR